MWFIYSDHLGSYNTFDNCAPPTCGGGWVGAAAFVEENIGSYSTPYRFTSKELDDETELYYYGARYYDPKLSMFLGVDPMAENYPSITPYLYCANNPIVYFDPDGKRIVVVGKSSKKYVMSYLSQHFGKLKIFRINAEGELRIRNRRFRKFYQNATLEQRKLLDGMKAAIKAKETAQIHINEDSDNFEISQEIGGGPNVLVRYINSDKAGFTLAPKDGFINYNIFINDKRGNNEELNSSNGNKTGKSASSLFFHEVLDEFLNYHVDKNVNNNSAKLDKVQFQNAALKNIKKGERDGSDHQ